MKTILASTIQGDVTVTEDTEAPNLARVFGKIIVHPGVKFESPCLICCEGIEVLKGTNE